MLGSKPLTRADRSPTVLWRVKLRRQRLVESLLVAVGITGPRTQGVPGVPFAPPLEDPLDPLQTHRKLTKTLLGNPLILVSGASG